MSYPIAIAATIVSLAFVAHTVVGIGEALSTRPRGDSSANASTRERIDRNWAQSVCFALLGQWVMWMACAALLWWGARGL
jgi:hypothetical protein